MLLLMTAPLQPATKRDFHLRSVGQRQDIQKQCPQSAVWTDWLHHAK